MLIMASEKEVELGFVMKESSICILDSFCVRFLKVSITSTVLILRKN